MSRDELSLFACAIVAVAALSCSAAAAATEEMLHTFCSSTPCPNGTSPLAGLVDVNGVLYGTTEYGGKANHGLGRGVIFAVDPKSGRETVEQKFSQKNGSLPFAGMIEVNGLLYGTTNDGGNTCDRRGCGTVFSFDPATGTETVVHAFTEGGTDGGFPQAGLIDMKGTLYGTTVYGGTADYGTVFAIDPATGAETVLHSFQNNGSDGYNSAAGLVAVNGTLYGTAQSGGTYGDGIVFAIDPETDAETVLHSFGGTDGSLPKAGLIAVKGVLYGTTATGGAYNGGTVFSLDPQTGVETVVYSFCKEANCADGAIPVANLIDVKGVLYGTTASGGASESYGTVFSLDPATGAETVLYSFCSQDGCTDGWSPQAGLIDIDGTMYGTTSRVTLGRCGSLGYCGGVVFSIKP